MKRRSYEILRFPVDEKWVEEAGEELNALGREGWRVVGTFTFSDTLRERAFFVMEREEGEIGQTGIYR